MNARSFARPARLALLLAVLLATLAPAATLAAANGSVYGTVANQTTGQPLSGATITLSRFENNPPVQTDSKTATTGPDGAYRFDGLDTTAGIVYVTSLTYQGVTYSSGMIKLSDAADQQKDIAVYDTTADASQLSLDSRGLVLSDVDSATGQISVFDIFALQMGGNLALGPDQDGRTVRFSVPANASEVTPLSGFDLGTPSIEGSTVFATAPLPPGPSSATLGYTIPYDGTSVPLELDVIYPTGSVRVLVPISGGEFTGAITVNGAGLTDGGVVTIQDKQYRLWTSGSLAANQRVAFTIDNLPRFERERNKLHTVEPAVLAGLVFVVASGLTAWVVAKRGLYRERPVTLMPAIAVPLEERRETLADQLRALENEHELDRVDERVYQSERHAILEELRRLSRQARGIGEDE